MGCRQDARSAACLRRQSPSKTRPPNRRGRLARKLTVLCWHLRTKETDYRWARPALLANKRRTMELKAGRPQEKGNQPGPAHAYNIKTLRNQEIQIARQAEHAYEQFVAQWETRPKKR